MIYNEVNKKILFRTANHFIDKENIKLNSYSILINKFQHKTEKHNTSTFIFIFM